MDRKLMFEAETYPLLQVEKAEELVLAGFEALPGEEVPILETLGLVLAEDVRADMDIPPHHNSAMDGYAVRWEDVAGQSIARLPVVAEIPAGRPPGHALRSGEAMRIMTGAVLPEGADTVVRFEDTRIDGPWVEILRVPSRGANVRLAGEDVRRGSTVLPAGTIIRPQEIGMLASVGRKTAWVHRRPLVAILATGDEVVDIDAQVLPGQIRNINSYSNAAQVLRAGGRPLLLGIARDRRDELVQRLRQGLEAGADLFLTSGGVSVGDFDLVKEVLATEGRMEFWHVNMKPGKPMAFGSIGGVPLLGLPGNPVSAMVSFMLFARPAIRKMLGYSSWEPRSAAARLRSPIARKDSRRHYLRVRLLPEGDDWEADLTGDQGSGILSSMVAANGLAVIPEECDHLPAGSEIRVLLFE